MMSTVETLFIDTIDDFSGDNEFLSNFFERPFMYAGRIWPTSEHAFQALKCRNLDDRDRIAAAASPGIAKKLGKAVQLRANWDSVKFRLMIDILDAKFEDPGLRAKLLATTKATLIEGNSWHDNVWGNCTCEKCAEVEGRNMLGRSLMNVRERIQLVNGG